MGQRRYAGRLDNMSKIGNREALSLFQKFFSTQGNPPRFSDMQGNPSLIQAGLPNKAAVRDPITRRIR
jgi:hypothetical protein